jgi:hypothetical protein
VWYSDITETVLGTKTRGSIVVASFIFDPKHWHTRAAEARAIADKLDDPQSKETMLRIAMEYQHLAQRAAERAKDHPGSGKHT